METLKKKTTKKEQQELLLREAKKTLQKELAFFKKKTNLTSEEILKMKEDRKFWNERMGGPHYKKLTPLEDLQFEFWREKRNIVASKVEQMIFNSKPGPYDHAIEELKYFDIDVRMLLLNIVDMRDERDEYRDLIKKVFEIQKDVLLLNKNIAFKEYAFRMDGKKHLQRKHKVSLTEEELSSMGSN